jgi:AraC-like DNA-binding protein
MSSAGDTVSMPFLRGILDGAKALGLDPTKILAASGIDGSLLEEPDERVARKIMYELWAEIEEQSGDDAVGLHIAEHTKQGAFAVLDYAVRNSPTLREGYRRIERYSHLLHDGVDIVFEVTDSTATLSFHEPDQSPRHIAEWAVCSWLIIGRQMLGESWLPREISFQHPRPASVREHQWIFGAPVNFDRHRNELVLDPVLLDREVVDADLRLSTVISRYAQQLWEQLPRAESHLDQVRQGIARELRGGEATLESVAKRMHMHPRTLQRKLKAEGASFKQVLDETRCELAKKHLSDSSIAIEEAAFLLGYSEPSAFSRAFKRWTGLSPGEYRRAG